MCHFFGICLGMQIAVVEFARNVLKLCGADSTEMNPETKYPVIDLMEEQKQIIDKGGDYAPWSLRLQSEKGFQGYGCLWQIKDNGKAQTSL